VVRGTRPIDGRASMADAVQQSWVPVIAGARERAAPRSGAAPVHAAALDARLRDVPAADRHHRRAGRLSGALLDLPVDPEQDPTRFIGLGNFSFLLSRDAFWMVGVAVGDLRAHGRAGQGADRADHRPSRE